MMRVVVAGALANKPSQGGEAWVRLSWVLGLMDLGCEVHFAEQLSPGADAAWFEEIAADFGIAATLIGAHDTRELDAFAKDADLLVNISGHLTYAPIFERVARRAFVDIDPGFTQFWHAEGNAGARLEGHDVFFTIGENIGSPECPIPAGGIEWRKTRPPVVLAHWPVASGCAFEKFTTIANWRGPFGPVEFDGVRYGLKVHEFRKVLALPRRAALPFEIALNIHAGDAADRDALLEQGWRLTDPAEVAGTPRDFREFIRHSSAEFSVAQGIYTQTRSGWFSDRTAHYLASGKPALVQETGGSVPAGEGLLTFQTLDEAAAGAADIAANYARHCRAARALAEEFFDARQVLRRFLDDAFSSKPAAGNARGDAAPPLIHQ